MVSTPGKLIAIVGPSGSGKDTLISYVRDRISDEQPIMFVRRTVTRAADVEAEDHDTLNDAAFARAQSKGAFCVTWKAHGHAYGLPADALRHVEAGGVAIANGSRRAIGALKGSFPDCLIVQIIVAPDVLARRLAERGRETAGEIETRLERAESERVRDPTIVEIDNSGEMKTAGEALLALILKATSTVSTY